MVYGDAGNDMTTGGNGDDIINGGEGADLLIGGRGNDLFVFDSVDGDIDLLLDFNGKTDNIQIAAEGSVACVSKSAGAILEIDGVAVDQFMGQSTRTMSARMGAHGSKRASCVERPGKYGGRTDDLLHRLSHRRHYLDE